MSMAELKTAEAKMAAKIEKINKLVDSGAVDDEERKGCRGGCFGFLR